MKFALLVFSLLTALYGQIGAPLTNAGPKLPGSEKLDYQVEWHLITAGVAHIEVSRSAISEQMNMHLESAGAVNRLYRVVDNYRVQASEKACPTEMQLDAQEGKRHATTRIVFNAAKHKVSYSAQDLVKNETVQKELDVQPCTHEILSALMTLRTFNLEPGKSMTIPVTDGKKAVNVRIEAQAKETIGANGKQYESTRYEVFLFDNLLYRRKGRLLLWISNDSDRIPVQLRFQMGFPIGNVLVELQKYTK